MLENLPAYIPTVFLLTTLLTFVLFYFTLKKSRTDQSYVIPIMVGISLWLIVHMILSLNHFYTTNTRTLPPRLFLLFGPVFLLILVLFLTKKGRDFMDSLPLVNLTYISIVRIPVELCLYWLFLNKAVPELMTFAGRNFDILAGITAPFIAFFGFQKKVLSKQVILSWNIISLGLLLFIIVNALLSAPLAFQQFAFDQPNIAVAYFPFVWLPGFIVPVVLFGHLVSIRRLVKEDNTKLN